MLSAFNREITSEENQKGAFIDMFCFKFVSLISVRKERSVRRVRIPAKFVALTLTQMYVCVRTPVIGKIVKIVVLFTFETDEG